MADAGMVTDLSLIVVTVIIGVTVLLFFFVSSLVKKSNNAKESTKSGDETAVTSEESRKTTDLSGSGVSKSKKKSSEKWRSDSKQTFSNPWLITTLKGHSGQINDMDFSANNKYLATCAEDELDPGGGSDQCSGNSSGSEGVNNRDGSARPPGTLSRRQKRNRIRRDGSPGSSSSSSTTAKHSSSSSRGKNKKKGVSHGSGNSTDNSSNNCPLNRKTKCAPLRQYVKLNLSESDLYVFLRHYVLSPNQLLALGYPVESALYPGMSIIFKNPATATAQQQPQGQEVSSSRFDVNAREFVPLAQSVAPSYYEEDGGDSNVNGSTENGIEDFNNGHFNGYAADHGKSDKDSDSNSGESGDSSYSQAISNGKNEESDDLNGVDEDGCVENGVIDGDLNGTVDEFTEDGMIETNQLQSAQENCYSIKQNGYCQDEDNQTSVQYNGVDSTFGYNFGHGYGHETNGFIHCSSDEKKCVRCNRGFFVTMDGEYLTQEKCLYHWGKLQKHVTKNSVKSEYGCCRGRKTSKGCTTGKLHVWNGINTGINGPYDGYVKTKTKKSPPADGNFGIYSIDCEMCFTTQGLELTKVTVVGADGHLVYDTLIQPENYIIDYNTRFSGITAKDLSRATKTLKDVQNDLMGFVNADTILIGHGLENDLKALKIIHSTVIDTSVVFPHYYGLPYRRSLKSLVGCYLKKDIQQNSSGHDSYEDARACIELLLWKIRKDFRSLLEN